MTSTKSMTMTPDQVEDLVAKVATEVTTKVVTEVLATMAVEPEAPAKPQPKAAKAAPKGQKAKGRKGSGPKGREQETGQRVTYVTRKTRDRLIAETGGSKSRFAGMSAIQIAEAVVSGSRRLPKGWDIGPRTRHYVQHGEWPQS